MQIRPLASRLLTPSSPFWVFFQHGAGRIAVALKFFVLALVLGPDGVGLIGVGLLALAVVEALSDLGLMQALVQRRDKLTSAQLSAVWGWQLLRAVLIGSVLVILSYPAAHLFSIPEAFPIFAFVGVLVTLRGSVNLSMTIALRDMQTRRLGIFNSIFVVVDALIGIAVAWLTKNILAVFSAIVVVESMRWLASYRFFELPPRPSLSRVVFELSNFSKWIWMNNILNLFLNQADKLLVAKTLGVNGLGTYQMAQRFAQLVMADVGVSLAQYLFPKLSQQMRSDQKRAVGLTVALLFLMAAGGMATLLSLDAIAEALFAVLLGESWRPAAEVFRILLGGMYGGLLLAILVPFVKAEGKAWIVTSAALVQLLTFLMAFSLLPERNMTGVAYAASGAVWAAVALVLVGAIFYIDNVWQALRERWKVLLLLVGCLLFTLWAPSFWWAASILTLGLFAKCFFTLLSQLK